MKQRPVILNSKGQPIVLNELEQRMANTLETKIKNDLGFQIDITSLTAIAKKVSEQKFFTVTPSEYLPIAVGNGTWNQQINTWRSFLTAGSFSKGIINTGGNNSRMSQVNVGVDSVPVKIYNWMEGYDYSIFELMQAAQAGNWDLVTALEKARKKIWDLGIQEIAFLGINNDTNCLGLLTQDNNGVTVNTTVIPQFISAMSTASLKAFVASVLVTYRQNSQFTEWPDVFIVPEDDYNALISQASAEFPIKSVLELLEDAFKVGTKNPNFKVLPLAYANPNQSQGVLDNYRYTLLALDEESVRMDIPLMYTNTLANTINGAQFQSAAYGQFTGVVAYQPRTMLYFDIPNS